MSDKWAVPQESGDNSRRINSPLTSDLLSKNSIQPSTASRMVPLCELS